MPFDPYTFWTGEGRSRFFLIPDDQQLPPGDFVLRTLTGREMRVAPSALAEFEVSEREAKEWLKGEFGKLLDSARSKIDGFVQKLHEAAREADEEAKKSRDS